MQGAVTIAADAEPEDTGWWSTDDLWKHALDAVVAFVPAAGERRGATVENICRSLVTHVLSPQMSGATGSIRAFCAPLVKS